MTVLCEIKEAIISGNIGKTTAAIESALSEGMKPEDLIQKDLIEAMAVVGERFSNNEIYIPEMLMASLAMKSGLAILKPLMVSERMESPAFVVLGTVKGDLHDIGKNLVGIMMEGVGMKVYDLGVDVSPEKFTEAIKQYKPQFLGLSSLLTTTMPSMKLTLKAIENEGLRKDVKVLVGGAPVTQNFADEIGADGYASNAGDVITKIKELLTH